MQILFTRHAESDANILKIISNRDAPHRLTAVGVAQALGLADSLAGRDVKKIYASPILRAQETAGIVAASLGLPVTLSAALREFDCGGMEGRQDAEAWAAHRAVTQAWDEAQDYERRILPDGESFNAMKARFLPFMAALIAENRHLAGEIVLVSHGGMLHQMLPLVLVNVDRVFTKSHPLRNCQLVAAHLQDTGLVCSDWAGMGNPSDTLRLSNRLI